MNHSNVIVVMVVFIPIFIIILQQSFMLILNHIHRRKKGGIILTKELIDQLIGKSFVFSYAMTAGGIKGKVLSVQDNWIEIQTKKTTTYVNADYITNISEIKSK